MAGQAGAVGRESLALSGHPPCRPGPFM